MRNSSSQLYRYVSNLIVEYFTSQQILHGDRFNLYLEDKENIEMLYEALKTIPEA